MALKKEVKLASGVVVNHHRIISANIDWQYKSLAITVGHYISVDARTSKMDPVNTTRYRVPIGTFPLTDGGAIQNEMYNYLKTLPEYEDAEDEIVE